MNKTKKEAIRELVKEIERERQSHEKFKIGLENYLENMRKWLAEHKEKTLKLIEEYENKYGKLQ
ncbi:hypothetical protein [endosymbiont GvMRE of Glomus versiforme]|uniref:hypothetical protein n=1 Tax=endosymbiont GvMRE of Glomus versiforme TaxID=2039283 RepID=UPI000EEF1BF7|nr:hypothetical protein [endosymbiont GvMRE of Glomus versiforme]RHZ37170.1 hypothetical protein GvMRE_I1g479 [endosymbiont GvMRE of Glomus versiforme]